MTLFRLFCAAAAALASATPAAAQSWKQVFPLQTRNTLVIQRDGASVFVTPPPATADDEELSEAEEAARADAKIVVRFGTLPPYEVPPDEYRSTVYGISAGVGRMAPGDAAATVLIGGYSGGAHCCATLQAVSLVDGRPVLATLPNRDGAPPDEFPRDLDGDGTRDLEWTDDSLLYAFASHAGSWSIPRIYHFERGQPVDVSRNPGFAPIYRKLAEEALAACRAGEGEPNGACAAYAYARAILGDAEEGIRTAASLAQLSDWYPTDCLVAPVDFACPAGQQRQFAGFEDALRWIMRKNGYLQ
jgi:hypothetical protein